MATDTEAFMAGTENATTADVPASVPSHKRVAQCVRGIFQPPAGADLPTRVVASYGVGAISFSMLSDVPGFYLNPFLLQVAKVNPSSAGTLLLIAKLVPVCARAAICLARDV